MGSLCIFTDEGDTDHSCFVSQSGRGAGIIGSCSCLMGIGKETVVGMGGGGSGGVIEVRMGRILVGLWQNLATIFIQKESGWWRWKEKRQSRLLEMLMEVRLVSLVPKI